MEQGGSEPLRWSGGSSSITSSEGGGESNNSDSSTDGHSITSAGNITTACGWSRWQQWTVPRSSQQNHLFHLRPLWPTGGPAGCGTRNDREMGCSRNFAVGFIGALPCKTATTNTGMSLAVLVLVRETYREISMKKNT